VGVITDIKAGNDTTSTTNKLNDDTIAFANFLNSVNSNWDVTATTDIFTRMENLYMDQTRFRMKQEWASGVAAADQAYNIMVVQQLNGDPSFADILSSGIIGDSTAMITDIY
jgi:hypothetical protein